MKGGLVVAAFVVFAFTPIPPAPMPEFTDIGLSTLINRTPNAPSYLSASVTDTAAPYGLSRFYLSTAGTQCNGPWLGTLFLRDTIDPLGTWVQWSVSKGQQYAWSHSSSIVKSQFNNFIKQFFLTRMNIDPSLQIEIVGLNIDPNGCKTYQTVQQSTLGNVFTVRLTLEP